MEYKITTSAILPQCENREEYDGLLVHIQPPVQLNSDAIARYLIHKDFEQLRGTESNDRLDVKDVTVIGSTSEQTTIYASIQNYHESIDTIPDAVERITERVTRDVTTILRFMGAKAIVE